MIIRDPYEMTKFAGKLESYVDEVRLACERLKSVMNSSATLIKDAKGKEAVERITEHINAILNDLPSAVETIGVLRLSAQPLYEIEQTIKFR